MSGEKKDLTRIEDLDQYIHELDQEEDILEDPFDPPGMPSDEEDSPFDSSFSSGTEEEPFEDPFSDASELDPEDSTFTLSEETDLNSEGPTDFSLSSEDTLESLPSDFEEDPFSLDAPVIEDILPPIDEPAPLISEEVLEEIEEVVDTPVIETAPYVPPENFEDVKQFAESSSFSEVSTEGNPSFSVLLKNIRFVEDVNDVLIILKELGLMTDSEEQVKARLMRGSLLVPRISEFAAISLAHKLRRFDLDIQLGLSDEIHPPKHKESPEVGLVSKQSLYQNQVHHFQFSDPKLEISQIIVSATSNLEGHQVVRYIGVASEHKIVDGHIVENEDSDELPRYYTELAQKLRAHALKAHANAVVGLNYQLTPIPSELGISVHKYRLSCTGNLVWVHKL